jgi:hypothetical protein
MTTMFVRHQVSDFAQWKQEYEGFDATRRELGVKADAVYQASDDPNDVTVTHEFASLPDAKAFVESAALREAMQRAGVAGEPTIWFADQA